MSIDIGYNILDRYHSISNNQYKKRFLRKPNLTEASESFTALGQQCENLDLPSYAGLCFIAAARCEGSLGNIPGETSSLLRSARQFLEAEERDFNIGCLSVSGENLQTGLGCYTHAANRFPENSSIPIGLDLEITEFLKKIGRLEYVETYLCSAISLADKRPVTKIFCLQQLGAHFTDSGDYVGALEVYKEIVNISETLSDNGARSEILLKCEINIVFLLLILRPSPQKLPTKLATILEKYTWGDKSDQSIKACKMTEKLFLLMQSLVVICQSLDTSSLTELESDFWPFLSRPEKDLLRNLVKNYCG